MSVFSRQQIGWVEPIEITEDGDYAIQSSAISSQVYMISAPFPTMEYLLIENRQPIKWDGDWPVGGIVIYHVDEFKDGQTERGYPGLPNFPLEHYMVSIVQADGKFDIEKGVNNGDAGDFWTKGMTLGPGGPIDSSNVKWPNTDSYSNAGIRAPTGLSITITSPSRMIMTFEVRGLGDSNGTKKTRCDSIPSNLTATRSQYRDPDSTMQTLKWILSMLAGSAALIGLLILLL